MQTWIWNTAADRREYLKAEIEQGRLRQGWGYDDSQDLRVIQQAIENKETPTGEQKQTWSRCQAMLNEIEAGDYILVKNIPSETYFTIVEVDGPYGFSIDEDVGDQGHFIPVIKRATFHKNSELVPGNLSSAVDRERYPIRRSHAYNGAIRQLAAADAYEARATQPEQTGETWDRWSRDVAEFVKRAITDDGNWRLAEKLVEHHLTSEGLEVKNVAGPTEQGADLLASVPTPFNLKPLIAVQVKFHTGTEWDSTAVRQLKQAIQSYGGYGGLFVSFAEELSTETKREIQEAQKTYNIDVLFGSDLYERLAATLVR